MPDDYGISHPYGTSVIMVNGSYQVVTDPNAFPVSSGQSAVVAQAANAAFNAAQAGTGPAYTREFEQNLPKTLQGVTPASYAAYLNESSYMRNVIAQEKQSQQILGTQGYITSAGVPTDIRGGVIGTGPGYITTPQGIATIPAAGSPIQQAYQNIALFGVAAPGVQTTEGGSIKIAPENILAANAYVGAKDNSQRFVIPGARDSSGKLDPWAEAINALPTRTAQEAYISRNDDPYARIAYYSKFAIEPSVTAKDVISGAMGSYAGIPGGLSSLGDTTTSKIAGEYMKAGMTPIGAYASALETQRVGTSDQRLANYYLNQEDIAKNFGIALSAEAHYLTGKGWQPYAGNPWETAADTYLESLKGYPTKGAISPLSFTTPLPTLEGKPVGSQEYAWAKAIGVDRNLPVAALEGTYLPSIGLAEARTGQIYQGIGIQSPLGQFASVEGAPVRPGLAFAEQGAIRIEPTALSEPGAKPFTVPLEGMVAPSRGTLVATQNAEKGQIGGLYLTSISKLGAQPIEETKPGFDISPLKFVGGVAGVVGTPAAAYEVGYATLPEVGFGAGEGLGVGELLASNPIGWGAAIGIGGTLAAEKMGVLGLTGPTQGLSVRTLGEQTGARAYRAGYEFMGAINTRLSEDVTRANAPAAISLTNIFPQEIVPKERSMIEVIPGIIPTSELVARTPQMIEVIPATLPGAELVAKLPSMIELQLYKPESQGKTQVETPADYAGKLRENYDNTQRNINRFYDQMGYSFPGGAVTNTPSETPTKNPYQLPGETPIRNPTEMPTRNPTITPYQFPTNFPTQFPTTNPPSSGTKIPEIKLTGLPRFGGPGSGGGSTASARGGFRGLFVERFNVGQGISQGLFTGNVGGLRIPPLQAARGGSSRGGGFSMRFGRR